MGGLVVLPGLPVAKGSPVRDERASRLLSVPAPTDKEAVSMYHSSAILCHPPSGSTKSPFPSAN